MRALLRTSVTLIACLAAAQTLRAQEDGVARFGMGGGLLVADHGALRALRSRGVTAFVRVVLPRFSAIVDASIDHVPRNTDIVSGPCPPPPAACGAVFVGPTNILTASPALQTARRVPPGEWLFHLGPSVHWLVDRKSGSGPLALGLRAGVGFRVGQLDSGLLLSAEYVHLFRGGTPPEWLLPITVGWEF
jgi:hypothetical protein